MESTNSFLIVTAGALRCALPLSVVREVMRPQPVKAAAGLAPSVLGASVIRGLPLPVVSLCRLLHQPEAEETRFVVVRTPGRDCVLAVGAIQSISSVDPGAWQKMPNLLRRIESAEAISVDDQDLMVSLSMARLIAELPEEPNP